MQICCLATGVICRVYSYADFELPDIGELFFVVIDKTFLLQASTQATVQIPMRNLPASETTSRCLEPLVTNC